MAERQQTFEERLDKRIAYLKAWLKKYEDAKAVVSTNPEGFEAIFELIARDKSGGFHY